MKRQRIAQVVLPLLIVTVIVGIWYMKNAGKKQVIPLVITEVNLDKIRSHALPVILDFGSDSCVPCQLMAPVLEKVHAEMQGKALIYYVDVWKYPKAVEGFPVRVIPTQVFYTADGRPYVPSEEIRTSIEFTLYYAKETNEHLFTVHEGGLTEGQMFRILAEMGVK
jgi:thioredoxin 1